MKKHSKKAAAGSKPSRPVGLDLGDKFCHCCILDGEEGEVMEEGPGQDRGRRIAETLRKRGTNACGHVMRHVFALDHPLTGEAGARSDLGQYTQAQGGDPGRSKKRWPGC